jgi:hypothetical protein
MPAPRLRGYDDYFSSGARSIHAVFWLRPRAPQCLLKQAK